MPTPKDKDYAGPTGRELPGEHWNARIIREQGSQSGPPGTEFEVEVQRTIYTTVTVKATDAEAAARQVNQSWFPLPPDEEWQTLKGFLYLVRDKDGNDLYEGDGS